MVSAEVRIRRAFAYVLLSLVLVLSQQMGISHGLTHSGHGKSGQLRSTGRGASAKALAPDQGCAQCLAFAQLASPLGSPFYAFQLMRADAPATVAAASTPACAKTVRAFQPRAPPALS
ncbi:MAG TPA: hypothetical protein DCW29_08940 [Janthinobacterium sp.]|nr:hypothetical protein [Janthinobacterium sp.]